MSKPKFTPGPWRVSHGEFIVAPEFEFENPDRAAYEMSQFGGALIAARIDQANARLIAAAPDMYDLLKQFCDGMQECESEYDKSGVASSMFVPFQEVLAKINQNERDKV